MAILETERLLLREWTLEDIPRITEIYGSPDVMRHIGDGHALTPAETERGIRATLRRYRLHGMGMLCIESRGDGRILGHCGLQRWEGTLDVEIGFLLRRDAWGVGYGSEAARAVLDHGFGSLGLRRIVAIVHPGNSRSLALLRRLGMSRLGETAYKGREGLWLYSLDSRAHPVSRAHPDPSATDD